MKTVLAVIGVGLVFVYVIGSGAWVNTATRQRAMEAANKLCGR